YTTIVRSALEGVLAQDARNHAPRLGRREEVVVLAVKGEHVRRRGLPARAKGLLTDERDEDHATDGAPVGCGRLGGDGGAVALPEEEHACRGDTERLHSPLHRRPHV